LNVVAGESGLVVAAARKQEKLARLAQWCTQQLSEVTQVGKVSLADEWLPLGGDAGFRHYFRLPRTLTMGQKPLLAVWSPPETEKNAEFVSIAKFLRAEGIDTPEIFAWWQEEGFFLIEDLGESLLLEQLDESQADPLYASAMELLHRLHAIELDRAVFPHYSEAELLRELRLFSEWFVQRLLAYTPTEEEVELIESCFELLSQSALSQPQVIVHRDFHSRNLIYRENRSFGVIDFQDAVIGPFTYDLVSLLRDCYISWPEEKVAAWLHAFYRGAGECLGGTSEQAFIRWFDWMGLQRHLKVLGIFSRLNLRDGKSAYLHDLPLVLRYVREILRGYPEFRAFGLWFEERLMPRIVSQPWMLD